MGGWCSYLNVLVANHLQDPGVDVLLPCGREEGVSVLGLVRPLSEFVLPILVSRNGWATLWG